MSAIRLARAYTNRKYIIKFEGCYHGHADSLLVKAGSGVATLEFLAPPVCWKSRRNLLWRCLSTTSKLWKKLLQRSMVKLPA